MLKYFDIYSSNVYAKNESISITYDQAAAIISWYAAYLDKHVDTPSLVFVVPNSLQSQLLMLAALRIRKVILINPQLLSISPDLYKAFSPCTILSFKSIPGLQDHIVIDPETVLSKTQHTSFDDKFSHTSLTLLTSGTTGDAKAVILNPSEIESYGTELKRYIDFDETDCMMNLLPFYHGFGLTRILTSLTTGGSQFIPCNSIYKKFMEIINDTGSTWTSLVPSQVKLLNRLPGKPHQKFRFATTSAAHCDRQEFEDFQKNFDRELLSEYGCTETSIISSNTLSANKTGSVGVPTKDMVKIIDGEIWVEPSWKEQKTLICTGDMGFVDDDGFLWVQGRTKEMIKRNGITFIPQEIENNIKRCAGVDESAVYIHGADRRGDLIGIIYTGDVSESELRLYINSHLKDISKSIVEIKGVDEIPTTFNKIKRLALKQYVDQL